MKSGVDTAMDIFLVADLPREYIPDLTYDAELLSTVFAGVPYDVTIDEVDEQMTLGRAGIGAVTNLLAADADNKRLEYPFAAAHFLDGRTPGSYPWGAQVAGRYFEALLKRIDGDMSADDMLIGVHPSADAPLVTLDHTRPDARILLLFGMGLDRASIVTDSVLVYDEANDLVPVTVSPFRGDEWCNAILVTPQQDWAPSTTYTVRISNSLSTLYGTSPAADFEVTFTSCSETSSRRSRLQRAGPCSPLQLRLDPRTRSSSPCMRSSSWIATIRGRSAKATKARPPRVVHAIRDSWR